MWKTLLLLLLLSFSQLRSKSHEHEVLTSNEVDDEAGDGGDDDPAGERSVVVIVRVVALHGAAANPDAGEGRRFGLGLDPKPTECARNQAAALALHLHSDTEVVVVLGEQPVF